MKKYFLLIFLPFSLLAAHSDCFEDYFIDRTFRVIADGRLVTAVGHLFSGHFEPAEFNGNAFGTVDLYLMHKSGFFAKLGGDFGLSPRDFCGKLHGWNAQLGKYWHPYGAVRLGLFRGDPGIGFDYWLSHNKFPWLTTLEIRKPDRDFKKLGIVGITWLNRVFVTDHAYLAFGLEHVCWHDPSSSITTGFVGFGFNLNF